VSKPFSFIKIVVQKLTCPGSQGCLVKPVILGNALHPDSSKESL